MKKKITILLTSLALLLSIAVAGTVALLITQTEPVENTFTPSITTPEIHEEFDGKVKNNVTIKNSGEVDAYIRATVAVNWVDSSGQIYGVPPVAGTDYQITWTPGTDSNWVQGSDGHYYYTEKVAPGAFTDVLFTGCEPKTELSGYQLAVDVFAQAIQADGEGEPVIQAWGIDNNGSVESVENNKLKIKQ